MPALFVSYIRTVVPFVVGWLLTLALRAGIDIDSETVTGAVTVGLGVAYYLLFRGLEWLGERLPGTALQTIAGVLLGWARPPAYPKWETLAPVDPNNYGSTTG